MSNRFSHQPQTEVIEESAIAALAAPHAPTFRVWVGDARTLGVVNGVHFCELRRSGRQRKSTNVILLEQVADAASVPCGELSNEMYGEGVYATADLLRPVYDASEGGAGLVSFALAPLGVNDLRGIAAAARRMWYRARRPNVLVQIAATPAGIRAVFRLIPEAISVHVTQIASYDVYRGVAEAYIAGLRHRAERGLPISGIASFATLPASGEGDLGRIANAYRDIFSDSAFTDLRRLGARSQVLLRQPPRGTCSR